ncbi:unnamed protein product [Ectocarpus sp. 12 AP-2014]
MACPEGESFTVDSDVKYENSRSFNGCYEAIEESWGDETAYFLDGEEEAGTPGMYPSSNFDDEHGVWVLAYFTTEGEFSRRCKDAAEEDSSTVHPADVLQWDCKDADDPDNSSLYPDEDAAVTITCGCDSPTPSPTPSPTLSDTLSPTTPASPFLTSSPTSSPTTPALGPASPSSPSSELTTETSSGKGTPVGAIAGVAVVGVLVVGSAILAVLFRTGRLKNCRGGSRNTAANDGVSPGYASDSVPNGGTSVEATTGPTRGHYPVAHQYPAAV